jgi:hypothetical protein
VFYVSCFIIGSHAQNLVGFHWRYPPITPLAVGRQSKGDIDVLIVDGAPEFNLDLIEVDVPLFFFCVVFL